MFLFVNSANHTDWPVTYKLDIRMLIDPNRVGRWLKQILMQRTITHYGIVANHFSLPELDGEWLMHRLAESEVDAAMERLKDIADTKSSAIRKRIPTFDAKRISRVMSIWQQKGGDI